ncbi:hypothetical protein [Cryptosporangium phraense]|uniref:hypothetical protein n=1 Tax=Cryptosporangium phraense TaxID=2593070 RepID=UPI001478AFDE|nr:hypothetical protein [Cryptosporangium phraense]
MELSGTVRSRNALDDRALTTVALVGLAGWLALTVLWPMGALPAGAGCTDASTELICTGLGLKVAAYLPVGSAAVALVLGLGSLAAGHRARPWLIRAAYVLALLGGLIAAHIASDVP